METYYSCNSVTKSYAFAYVFRNRLPPESRIITLNTQVAHNRALSSQDLFR